MVCSVFSLYHSDLTRTTLFNLLMNVTHFNGPVLLTATWPNRNSSRAASPHLHYRRVDLLQYEVNHLFLTSICSSIHLTDPIYYIKYINSLKSQMLNLTVLLLKKKKSNGTVCVCVPYTVFWSSEVLVSSLCVQGSKLWIIMEYLGGGSALDLVRYLTLSVVCVRVNLDLQITCCLCVVAGRAVRWVPDSHDAERDSERPGLPALWEEDPQGHQRCVCVRIVPVSGKWYSNISQMSVVNITTFHCFFHFFVFEFTCPPFRTKLSTRGRGLSHTNIGQRENSLVTWCHFSSLTRFVEMLWTWRLLNELVTLDYWNVWRNEALSEMRRWSAFRAND